MKFNIEIWTSYILLNTKIKNDEKWKKKKLKIKIKILISFIIY